MAQDDDERDPELQHAELDAALGHGIDRIAGVAHDEQLAETAAEQELGGHARIGAAHEHRERRLAARLLQPALTALRPHDRAVRLEFLVAFAQELQGLVCCKVGLARRGGMGAKPGEREARRARPSGELEKPRVAGQKGLGGWRIIASSHGGLLVRLG